MSGFQQPTFTKAFETYKILSDEEDSVEDEKKQCLEKQDKGTVCLRSNRNNDDNMIVKMQALHTE